MYKERTFLAKDLLGIVSLFAKAIETNNGPIVRSSHIWNLLGQGIDTSLLPGDDLTVVYHNPREYVRKYENVHKLFSSLTWSVEQAMMEFKAMVDVETRSRGIDKLPNEILSIIFEDAVSTPTDASRLMQVSPRFRSLVMSSPRVWTNCPVDLATTADDLSFIVEHSRGLPLEATLTSTFKDEADVSAAQRILSYRSSLGKLSIELVEESVPCEPLMGVHLPLVNELSLKRNGRPAANPTRPFYETWDLPRLRHLETNFIPPLALGKNIVSLTYRFDYFGFSGEFNSFLGFLASCPALEELGMTFVLFHDFCNEPSSGFSIALYKLRSLSMEISEPDHLPWAHRFFQRVAIDDVSAVCLKFEFLRRNPDDIDVLAKRVTPYSETETWAPAIVSRLAALPRLQKVVLNIEEGHTRAEGEYARSEDQYIWAYNLLLRDLPPSLETFVSKSPLVNIQFNRTAANVDSRHPVLRISHGKTLTTEQLSTLVQWVGAGEVVSTHVKNCPLIPPGDPPLAGVLTTN